MTMRRSPMLVLLLFLSLSATPSCVRSLATGALADALSTGGGVYASDDDPELVSGAVPFGLKTMESVLVEEPEHRGLLTALASGFTQYGYAFVEQEADEVQEKDIDRALSLRRRARRLYARARSYGMRGLEAAHSGFMDAFAKDPEHAVEMMTIEDVPLLYWTAAAWGLAIGASKDDPEAIADLPRVGPLARRALELDEGWNRGALHEFFISFEASSPGGSLERARKHFARAVELSRGLRAGPFVSLAEKVCIREQNAGEFHRLLRMALAIDVEKTPDDRLANVVLQRRAKRLEARSGELFLDDTGGAQTSSVSISHPAGEPGVRPADGQGARSSTRRLRVEGGVIAPIGGSGFVGSAPARRLPSSGEGGEAGFGDA